MIAYYEEPDFKVVMFETEEIMSASTFQPETDEDGWTTDIVKP